VVLVDEDYIGKELPATPAYCNWKTAADAGSKPNIIVGDKSRNSNADLDDSIHTYFTTYFCNI
jgi:hypothetical protein